MSIKHNKNTVSYAKTELFWVLKRKYHVSNLAQETPVIRAYYKCYLFQVVFKGDINYDKTFKLNIQEIRNMIQFERSQYTKIPQFEFWVTKYNASRESEKNRRTPLLLQIIENIKLSYA